MGKNKKKDKSKQQQKAPEQEQVPAATPEEVKDAVEAQVPEVAENANEVADNVEESKQIDENAGDEQNAKTEDQPIEAEPIEQKPQEGQLVDEEQALKDKLLSELEQQYQEAAPVEVESNQVQEVHHNEEAVMQEYPDANWNHDGNQEVKDLLDMSEPNQEVEVPIENSNEAQQHEVVDLLDMGLDMNKESSEKVEQAEEPQAIAQEQDLLDLNNNDGQPNQEYEHPITAPVEESPSNIEALDQSPSPKAEPTATEHEQLPQLQEVPLDDNQEAHLNLHEDQPKQSVEEPALSKTDSNPYAEVIINDKEQEVAAPVSENPFDELITERPSPISEENKELEQVDLLQNEPVKKAPVLEDVQLEDVPLDDAVEDQSKNEQKEQQVTKKAKTPKKVKPPVQEQKVATPMPEPQPAAASGWGGGISSFWQAAPQMASLASLASAAKDTVSGGVARAAEQVETIRQQKLEEQKQKEKAARKEAKRQEKIQRQLDLQREEEERIQREQDEEKAQQARLEAIKRKEEEKIKKAEEKRLKEEAFQKEQERLKKEEQKRALEYQKKKELEDAKKLEEEQARARLETLRANRVEQERIENEKKEKERKEQEKKEAQLKKEMEEQAKQAAIAQQEQKAQELQELPFDPMNPLGQARRASVNSKSSKHSMKAQSNVSKASKASKTGTKSSISKNRVEQPVNLETKESSAADLKNEDDQKLTGSSQNMGEQPVQQTNKSNVELNLQTSMKSSETPERVPDNSDVMSNASFNTGVLYDQFDNMDSISQVDNSQQSQTGSGIDLLNVGIEIKKRDKKIEDLHADRAKLKGLLKKAKAAIDSINLKYKESQQSAQQADAKTQNAMQKNRDLLQTLDIIQKQRNGIELGDVKSILCRVRCNDVGYTLIQTKSMDCVWYQDSLVINVQEQMTKDWKDTKQVNYNTVFKQQKQTEDNLEACMAQYEERLKRVNEYMEQSNSSFLNCQEELQQCRQKHSKEMQERDNALSLLIEKSIDIKTNIQSIDEKATSTFAKQGRKSNIADLISDLEMQITNMVSIPGVGSCQDQNVIEIKNHLIDLYQRVGVGLLKKHLLYHERLQQSSNEWQETTDQLINEHQTLKDDRDRTEAELQGRIKQLTDQLNKLKTDHYDVKKAAEENSEKLKIEINNSLNSHYMKNILTSYFTTTDTTVQINLIKVVFKVMKFTDEEQAKILEVWNENNKGFADRLWSFGGM